MAITRCPLENPRLIVNIASKVAMTGQAHLWLCCGKGAILALRASGTELPLRIRVTHASRE